MGHKLYQFKVAAVLGVACLIGASCASSVDLAVVEQSPEQNDIADSSTTDALRSEVSRSVTLDSAPRCQANYEWFSALEAAIK